MRVLLTGKDGQVGRELERVFGGFASVVATGRQDLDLADVAAIQRQVRELRPDLILNAAAHTQVDRAESEPDLAMAINGTAPGILAEEARRAGATLVHYSTDYVFDGERDAPYDEDDPVSPVSAYGRSKRAGEEAVLASGCRGLVLRTSWVYAPRGRNFLLTIARKAMAGEPLRVVDDQTGVPTTASFIAASTRRALEALDAKYCSRMLYHVVPDGCTTWYRFAREIAARVAPGARIDPIPSRDYPQAARRPRHAVLDNRRAKAELGLPATPWERLLDECVQAAGLR